MSVKTTRYHKALFDRNLPFKHKVEQDRTKFTRKTKHKKSFRDNLSLN